MPGTSRFIPIKQVADRLGCSVRTVQRLADDPINLKLSEMLGETGVWSEDLARGIERIRDSGSGDRSRDGEI